MSAPYTHLQLEELWTNARGPTVNADTAAAIAQAESGGNPDAIANTAYPSKPGYRPPPPGALREYSVGLWQINLLAHPQYTEAQMLDPAQNAKAAVAISGAGISFSAWSTYTSGAYLPYLTGVTGGGPTTEETASSHDMTSLNGWHEVNIALSRNLWRSLHHSRRLTRATARNLHRRPAR